MSRKNTEADFWRKVKKTDSCWLYTPLTGNGYGQFLLAGRLIMAHRYSYELSNGPIPNGLLACHKCDVRNCVNPSHLFLGTAKDNALDMSAKKRGRGQMKTHCVHGHEYLEENSIPSGYGGRRCRKCAENRSKTRPRPAPTRLFATVEHCANGHPWTEESWRINSDGFRICRICHKESKSRIKAARYVAASFPSQA